MRLDQSSMDISHIVDKVQSNQLDLQPDFQRGQVWSDSKKRRLIDTILREWYIPAIHIVVNDELDREEVLDGQQRLRTIIAFMSDEFPVDGKTRPANADIQNLDGLYYSELPDRVKSRFKRFTITTVRLRDYLAEEPGELFFRLNQLTALTAAEQRNALIGEPRNQVKRLVEILEVHFSDIGLGFTNARMNFDDVLSRLAVCLERRSLSIKLTSFSLEQRYREGAPFSDHIVEQMRTAISTLSAVYSRDYPWKQNKATLFSWLFFICDNAWASSARHYAFFNMVFNSFEASRGGHHTRMSFEDGPANQYVHILRDRSCVTALGIFNDRASSRVNDVTSLLLRDLALNLVASRLAPPDVQELPTMRSRAHTLHVAASHFHDMPQDVGERASVETSAANIWEAQREVG